MPSFPEPAINPEKSLGDSNILQQIRKENEKC
jgi:hypothetical protein